MTDQSPSSNSRVTHAEWLWVFLISLLLLALVSIPYIYAMRASTPERQFSGFLFALGDMNSYIAKMRYGAYDGWLFHSIYTHEPHRGALVYTHYIVLGKLAALISGQGADVTTPTLIIAYHAARLILGAGLLAVMYRFIAAFLDEVPVRRLAWIMASFSTGLGWLPVVLSLTGVITADAPLPIDFYIPEAYTILLLYGMPHIELSRLLMLAGWLLLFHALDRRRWQPAVLASTAWFFMGMVIPFFAALLGVIVAGWLLTLLLVKRALPVHEFRLAAVAGIGPVIVLLYNAWAFSTDPILQGWAVQNYLPSPPVSQYILAYILFVLVAVPAVIRLFRRGVDGRWALLVAWPLVSAALVYAPISVQRRLLEGIIIPLSVFAASGIFILLGDEPGKHRPKPGYRVKQVAAGALLILTLPSTFILLAGGALEITRAEWPMFLSRDELEALAFLQDSAPNGSIVLASHAASNIIPAYAGVRTYVGLGPETVNELDKIPRERAFFWGGMTDKDRRDLLDEIDASYVWIGPVERDHACSANCFSPGSLDLELIFDNAHIQLYAVKD